MDETALKGAFLIMLAGMIFVSAFPSLDGRLSTAR